ARVGALTREAGELHRRLERALPALDIARLESFDPDELCRLLPPGSAFIDLVRFVDFSTPADKKEVERFRYTAFALAPGRRAAFIALGEAALIDRAIHAWREAITSGTDHRKAAAEVARLVWRPLREKLPVRLTTLYVAPDGALALLPWGALPTGKG